MRRWAALVLFYLAAGVATLVIINADQSAGFAPLAITVVSSLVLALATRSGWAALLPWILIPLALPFGDTNQVTGGDDTLPVWWFAVEVAVTSAVLIVIAAGGRRLYDRRRRTDRTREAKAS